ncbi:hypothetical protein HMPREF1544_02881 [Mucor circinelloides 1006PhL]|uniref:Uncharacterized protein n=1 Tax=Mucor circinelloides f. circinelloides (strain 1006PhL) TaxID=1220926 RepID=S2KDE1_MUCC1|nr:hypothetical protein HMPREF1544_02881 [Mucor circinelloides 1006PhL]
MAAFLRPSDSSARFPYESCSIITEDAGCLNLKVVAATRETRRQQHIIKPLTVHSHASDAELSSSALDLRVPRNIIVALDSLDQFYDVHEDSSLN